jgi:chemotaxis protein MotB
MKPKYLQADDRGRDRWMVSYLDVLTILLILFVAVAARSSEITPPVPTIVPTPPTTRPAPVSPAPVFHRALIDAERKLVEDGLDPRLEPRGLVVSLPQAILFAPGEDRINPEALPKVEQIADVLRSIPNKISLAGHADPIPIHNLRFRNNWELAAARSMQLLDLLTTRFGIEEPRFSIVSYGSVDPRGPNETPDGRASNRRVEIVILDDAPAP